MSINQISSQELKEILFQNTAANILAIDVRTQFEHFTKKIPGVYSLPLDEIEAHIEQLKSFDKVYIHCQSGNRSMQACQKLAQKGLDNIVNVVGGIDDWEKAGFETKNNKRMPIMQQVMSIAGSLVLIGVGLSFVSIYWLSLSAFVGAGLLYAGLSGNCLMAMILSKMPWNQVKTAPLPWSQK
jgi:rhodanese-related sulfurtransferase